MTVSTTTNKIVQLGDGVTLTFSFPFAVRSSGQTDILVYLTATDGTITQLTYATQYSVVLNAAVAPNPTPVGGTVTLSVAPASGTLVTILRSQALTQTTSLANQGTLYQPVLESMDDSQEMQLQQLSELQGRALTVAVSDSAPSNLPPAAQRALLALTFDASGNPVASAIPATGVISSAMAPFVSAASIAAAKALLGYGTMANENIGAAGKGIADDGSGNARVNQTVTAVATNQSPAAAQHMTNYVSSGTNIFTLPKLTAVFNGYELWIFCLTNTATLSPNVADNFPGAAGGVSIVLTVGQCARLIGDGVSAWSIFVGRIPGIGSTQTRTNFTSGSGTYTVPAGCRRIVARFCGGGGGGGGPSGGGAGGNGGTTTFNAITAVGGGAGNTGSGGGGLSTGGAGGTGGAGAATLRVSGQPGQSGGGSVGATSGGVAGGMGGPSCIGAFGAGGLGGAEGGGATAGAGSGGGQAEYVELIINNPAASYAYIVGAGGAGGGAGGATGITGAILIDEFY